MKTSQLISLLLRADPIGDLPVVIENWDGGSGPMRPSIGVKAVVPDPLPLDGKPERVELWITTIPEEMDCE